VLGLYEVDIRILDYRDQLPKFQTRAAKLNARATPAGLGDTEGPEGFNREIHHVRAVINDWKDVPHLELRTKVGQTTIVEENQNTPALILNLNEYVAFDVKSRFTDVFTPENATIKRSVCKIKFYAGANICDPVGSKEYEPIPFTSQNTSIEPHQFVHTGDYRVTTTLTDKYGQTAEENRYVVVKNKSNYFLKAVFDYPLDARIPPAELTARDASARAPSRGNPLNPRVQPRDIGGIPDYQDYYPFVMHNSARLRRAAVRWNGWGNGINFRNQSCDSVRPYFNGTEVVSAIELYGLIDITDPKYNTSTPGYLFTKPPEALPVSTPSGYPIVTGDGLNCGMGILRNLDQGLREARSDNELFFSGETSFQSLRFDTFAGLRVPHIFMSIIPDNLLPGDATRPDEQVQKLTNNTSPGGPVQPTSSAPIAKTPRMVEENISYNADTQKDEFTLTVRVRQSEYLTLNRISFEVPLYAVNTNGAFLPTTNGYIFPKFVGLNDDEQSCVDCYMRNGKTYIRVTIDPRFYSFNSDVGPTGLTPLNLDLMKIRLSNYTSYRSPNCSVNNEEASTDKFHVDSGHALWGCALLSKELGTLSATVPEMNSYPARTPVPLLSLGALNFAGHLVFGLEARYMRALTAYADKKNGRLLKDVKDMLYSLPVYGGLERFATSSRECYREVKKGGNCDWKGVLLSAGVAYLELGAPGLGKFIEKAGAVAALSKRGSSLANVGDEAGGFARAFDDSAERAAARFDGDPKLIAKELQDEYKTLIDAVDACGQKCAKDLDSVFGDFQALGRPKEVSKETIEKSVQAASDAVAGSSSLRSHFELLKSLSEMSCPIAGRAASKPGLDCLEKYMESIRKADTVWGTSNQTFSFSSDEFKANLKKVCCDETIQDSSKLFLTDEGALKFQGDFANLDAVVRETHSVTEVIINNKTKGLKPTQIELPKLTLSSGEVINPDILNKVERQSGSFPNAEFILDEVKGGYSAFKKSLETSQSQRMIRNLKEYCKKLPNCGSENVGGRIILRDFTSSIKNLEELAGKLDIIVSKAACLELEAANIWIAMMIETNGFKQVIRLNCTKLR
jgi:hypothetical protein